MDYRFDYHIDLLYGFTAAIYTEIMDDALRSINDHGPGQIIILFLICFMCQLPRAWHFFGIVFLGATPEHFCIVHSTPHEEGTTEISYEFEYSSCGQRLNSNDSEDKRSCDEWTYSDVPYGPTIVSQAYELQGFTMISELFTPRCRHFTVPCAFVFWVGGIMTLPVLAYLIQDWRYLQLTISIPLLCLPLLYWVIPESPRWLLSVGRVDEANAILNKLAMINGRRHVLVDLSTPNTMEMKNGCYDDADKNDEAKVSNGGYMKVKTAEQTIEKRNDETTSTPHGETSYLHLFKGLRMTTVTLVVFTLWLTTSVTYYGLTFSAGTLLGDPYLSFFLSGAVELPAIAVNVASVAWFGRRITICFFLVVSSVCCFVTFFMPTSTADGVDLIPVIVTVSMIGKFAATISSESTCLCATEIFPTVIRNKGIALTSLGCRLGTIIAPFVTLLDRRKPMLHMVLFGVFSLVPSILVFLLPEMKGQPQPQTIKELEEMFNSKKKTRKKKRFRWSPVQDGDPSDVL